MYWTQYTSIELQRIVPKTLITIWNIHL